jgi:hypothetical protein
MTTATVTTTTGGKTVTLRKVDTCSGGKIEVMGDGERDYWRNQKAKYESEHAFTAATDLADLDRLMFLELLVHRATTWLGSGRNYFNELLSPSEESDCHRVIRQNSPLISTIKNDLGLTKSQRDREQFESVGAYINNLKARAREHGVKREKELTKALCLIKELFSIVGTFDRSDEIERAKAGFETEAEILDWVRKNMKPEFDAIDAYFRKHHQKFWVKTI